MNTDACAKKRQSSKRLRPYKYLLSDLVPPAPYSAEERNEHAAQSAYPSELEISRSLPESKVAQGDFNPNVDINFSDGIPSVEQYLDPFETHFVNADCSYLSSLIHNDSAWCVEKMPVFGGGTYCSIRLQKNKRHHSAPERSPVAHVKCVVFKPRLLRAAQNLFTRSTLEEQLLFTWFTRYRDVLFGGRTVSNGVNLQKFGALHILNHILKTRDSILKNNSKIAGETQSEHSFFHPRDQGFTRAKVLVLLPTRQSCVRMLSTIVELYRPDQQENKKRFEDEFVTQHTSSTWAQPADFQELFEGNTDDLFRIGVKFTRKTVKYFSSFHESDLILASPLGLRNVIDPAVSKENDTTFLTSIEIVLVDQADAILMQNWDHLLTVFSKLNEQPKSTGDCDFSRVRSWYLDGHARYLRQTIILSAFLTPEMISIFHKRMENVLGGKIKINIPSDGSLLCLPSPIKQTFLRFNSLKLSTDPDDRLRFFETNTVPWISQAFHSTTNPCGILVYVPSYLDLVRLSSFIRESRSLRQVPFGTISENNTPVDPETRRTRSHFLSGKYPVLLFSGRAHHFFRYVIKGVKGVLFYQLPDNPKFYEEMGKFLAYSIGQGILGPHEACLRVMYSRLDALRLERIVGSTRVVEMVQGAGEVYEFS